MRSTGDNSDIAVIIPAFNESGKIRGVIEGVLEQGLPPGNVIVVDDGSSDSTAEAASAVGIKVIRHRANRGKGAALSSGFREAASRPGISAVIALDADGQHNPAMIPDFINQFRETEADIIIGSRMHDIEGMPLIRKLTNKTTSSVISRLSGSHIRDSQSGYRLLSIEVLNRFDKMNSSHYDAESEILIRAGREGFIISEIPIDTIYKDETSSINPFIDTIRFISLVFRSVFW
ncbi:MAG: glycosyltransferase family 2 protein [Candidatus Krumholzibacteriales bacterium]